MVTARAAAHFVIHIISRGTGELIPTTRPFSGILFLLSPLSSLITYLFRPDAILLRYYHNILFPDINTGLLSPNDADQVTKVIFADASLTGTLPARGYFYDATPEDLISR